MSSFTSSKLNAKEWISNKLKEGRVDLFDLANKLASFTQRNDHTAGHAFLAKELGYKGIENKYNHILKLRDLERGMPAGLSEYEYNLYKDMIKLGYQDYGDDFKQVYDSM